MAVCDGVSYCTGRYCTVDLTVPLSAYDSLQVTLVCRLPLYSINLRAALVPNPAKAERWNLCSKIPQTNESHPSLRSTPLTRPNQKNLYLQLSPQLWSSHALLVHLVLRHRTRPRPYPPSRSQSPSPFTHQMYTAPHSTLPQSTKLTQRERAAYIPISSKHRSTAPPSTTQARPTRTSTLPFCSPPLVFPSRSNQPCRGNPPLSPLPPAFTGTPRPLSLHRANLRPACVPHPPFPILHIPHVSRPRGFHSHRPPSFDSVSGPATRPCNVPTYASRVTSRWLPVHCDRLPLHRSSLTPPCHQTPPRYQWTSAGRLRFRNPTPHLRKTPAAVCQPSRKHLRLRRGGEGLTSMTSRWKPRLTHATTHACGRV